MKNEPIKYKIKSRLLVMLTPVFVIAICKLIKLIRSRCLRHLLIVLTRVFVIIAICCLHDIQYFTIIYGYTLRAHF